MDKLVQAFKIIDALDDEGMKLLDAMIAAKTLPPSIQGIAEEIDRVLHFLNKLEGILRSIGFGS